MKIESRLAQIGSNKEPVTGAVSFPIYQCNGIPSSEAWAKAQALIMPERKARPARCWRKRLRSLESGDAGFACSSGMAALQTIFALFSQGDHLIVSLDLYGGTYRLLERIMTRFGVTASYVDTNDIDAMSKPCTAQYESGID